MRKTGLLVVVMCLLACDAPRPLPPLHAPADLLPEDEPVYLHAHLDRFIVSVSANDDRRYDNAPQVELEFTRLAHDMPRWHEAVGHPKRWLDGKLQRMHYQRTPEALQYRGARQRAVALGLLAMSVWQRNPGTGRPSPKEMDQCRRFQLGPECKLDPRTRCLERMVRMALGADPELFRKQLRKAAQQKAAHQKAAPP